MSQDLQGIVERLAGTESALTTRRAGHDREAGMPEIPFAAQIAAFYPYPRNAADNPVAAVSSPDTRARTSATTNTASLSRRRQSRGD